MKTMKTLSRRIAALLLVVTVGITALAPAASAANIQLPSLPKDQCVVDDAGVLSDSTTSELETLNAQLSSSCDGAQIGVLTVDYTGSATTEDYATEAFNTWGIGSSSKNNGVLILLVMQSDQYADGDYYLTYGDGFRSTMLADQASSLVQTMEDDFAAKKYDAAVLTCATNVANTVAEVYGVTLSGGTIYSDGSDTQTTRPSVEPVPPQKHYSIWESFIDGIFSMLAYIILFIAVFFIFIIPLGHSFGWFWGRLAGSAHGVGTEARALPAALTMTSAPAVVSTAAAREARAGLGLPVEAVSAVLAVWAAAPVLAEPGAAAAASAAWAAAAATAAEPDADAEHFLILNRATSAADAISYHICRAGVIFCLFLLRPSIPTKPCPSGFYAKQLIYFNTFLKKLGLFYFLLKFCKIFTIL